MTTQNNFPGRNRDQQDGTETHLWNEIEYVKDNGAVLKVKGTGTEDEEVTLANFGYGFNVPTDTDLEVTVVSDGSDTNNKYGMPQIPHASQRAWKENTGGIQNPLDGTKAVEFSPNGTHIRDALVALSEAGILTVDDGGNVYIRGALHVQGAINAGGDISTPTNLNAAMGPPSPDTAVGTSAGAAPTIPTFSGY